MSSAEPTFPRNNNVPPEKPARKQLHTLLQMEPNLVVMEDFANAKSAPPQIKNYSSAWSLSSPKGDGMERPYHPYVKRPIEPAAAPSTTEDDDDKDEYYDSNDDTSYLKGSKKPSYFQEQDEPLCIVVEDGLCQPWNWVEDIPVFPQQQRKSKSVAVPITTLSTEPPPPYPFNFESGGGGGQSPTPNDDSYQAQGGDQPQYGGSSTGPMGGSPSGQFPPGQPGYPPPPGGIGGPSLVGVVIEVGGPCPRCGVGIIYEAYSLAQIIVCLLGFWCCFCCMSKVKKCPNCGAKFGDDC